MGKRSRRRGAVVKVLMSERDDFNEEREEPVMFRRVSRQEMRMVRFMVRKAAVSWRMGRLQCRV